MINRIRPVNANFLNDIFLLHEQRVSRVKPKNVNHDRLSKIKSAISQFSLEDTSKVNNINIFEEFSPFMAHILRNKALKEIYKKAFGININDSKLTRYYHFLSGDSKILLYINLKPMSNIEEGITVIDEMGKTMRVDEAGQSEGVYCSRIIVDGRKIDVKFNYYIGFLREK